MSSGLRNLPLLAVQKRSRLSKTMIIERNRKEGPGEVKRISKRACTQRDDRMLSLV
jgi:hypothetical protein